MGADGDRLAALAVLDRDVDVLVADRLAGEIDGDRATPGRHQLVAQRGLDAEELGTLRDRDVQGADRVADQLAADLLDDDPLDDRRGAVRAVDTLLAIDAVRTVDAVGPVDAVDTV